MNAGTPSCERGFTIIELLIVVAIVGILANIAVPVAMEQLRRARALDVVNDFLIFRKAILEHQADGNPMPADSYPGRQPRGLEPYLEDRIDWSNGPLDYELDWENWKRADGRPKHPHTGVYYGLSLTTQNTELIKMIEKVYDGQFWYTLGNNYTFVIEPISGEDR